MFFDPENHVVKLCAEGIAYEGEPEKAGLYYQKAWEAAINNEERFIAAHYVARVQATTFEKLRWDRIALDEGDGKASFVSEQEAAGYIAGYALANDISEHSYPLEGPCPLTTACF
ncbi:MAG: hypothetical protein J7576_09855 [Siphonobacter aquaeclarae]|nr:hypothetical protein [Siphonobacter aquaeclarae]